MPVHCTCTKWVCHEWKFAIHSYTRTIHFMVEDPYDRRKKNIFLFVILMKWINNERATKIAISLWKWSKGHFLLIIMNWKMRNTYTDIILFALVNFRDDDDGDDDEQDEVGGSSLKNPNSLNLVPQCSSTPIIIANDLINFSKLSTLMIDLLYSAQNNFQMYPPLFCLLSHFLISSINSQDCRTFQYLHSFARRP